MKLFWMKITIKKLTGRSGAGRKWWRWNVLYLGLVAAAAGKRRVGRWARRSRRRPRWRWRSPERPTCVRRAAERTRCGRPAARPGSTNGPAPPTTLSGIECRRCRRAATMMILDRQLPSAGESWRRARSRPTVCCAPSRTLRSASPARSERQRRQTRSCKFIRFIYYRW